jgi:hypothetical protein
MNEIARQIDRAWSQHEPERDRVPGQIWRQLRAFKQEIGTTANVIEELLRRAPHRIPRRRPRGCVTDQHTILQLTPVLRLGKQRWAWTEPGNFDDLLVRDLDVGPR